jgi:hypothetical protein
MIRTVVIPCSLSKAQADALNRQSTRIYSTVLTTNYRIYRRSHQRRWLSRAGAERLNDYLSSDDPQLLHAHSKDAAQQAFYAACKTAKSNRQSGANYPHKRKYWRTTIWKQTGIRDRGDHLLLSRAPISQDPRSPPLYLAPGARRRPGSARCARHQHDRRRPWRDPSGGLHRRADWAANRRPQSA